MKVKALVNKIYRSDNEALLQTLNDTITKCQKKVIVTINSELFLHIDEEDLYKGMIDDKTEIVVDGVSVVKFLDAIHIHDVPKIPGIEIVQDLLELANENHYTLATLGATKEVVNRMKTKIKSSYPNIDYVVALDGFSGNDEDKMKEISKKEPDIILVAMGVPRQERIIFTYSSLFSKGVFIGCGGSLDVISGVKKRAPRLFQKTHMEWFYRACKEPFRFKKYYLGGKALLKLKKQYLEEGEA